MNDNPFVVVCKANEASSFVVKEKPHSLDADYKTVFKAKSRVAAQRALALMVLLEYEKNRTISQEDLCEFYGTCLSDLIADLKEYLTKNDGDLYIIDESIDATSHGVSNASRHGVFSSISPQFRLFKSSLSLHELKKREPTANITMYFQDEDNNRVDRVLALMIVIHKFRIHSIFHSPNREDYVHHIKILLEMVTNVLREQALKMQDEFMNMIQCSSLANTEGGQDRRARYVKTEEQELSPTTSSIDQPDKPKAKERVVVLPKEELTPVEVSYIDLDDDENDDLRSSDIDKEIEAKPMSTLLERMLAEKVSTDKTVHLRDQPDKPSAKEHVLVLPKEEPTPVEVSYIVLDDDENDDLRSSDIDKEIEEKPMSTFLERMSAEKVLTDKTVQSRDQPDKPTARERVLVLPKEEPTPVEVTYIDLDDDENDENDDLRSSDIDKEIEAKPMSTFLERISAEMGKQAPIGQQVSENPHSDRRLRPRSKSMCAGSVDNNSSEVRSPAKPKKRKRSKPQRGPFPLKEQPFRRFISSEFERHEWIGLEHSNIERLKQNSDFLQACMVTGISVDDVARRFRYAACRLRSVICNGFVDLEVLADMKRFLRPENYAHYIERHERSKRTKEPYREPERNSKYL